MSKPTIDGQISASEGQLSYAGWRVAVAAFVGVMFSFAAMVPYTFSLFLVPLNSSFGWKREAISRAFAIAALTVAAVSPLIGTLLDRFPARRIILPCILVFAAAMASLSLLRGSIAEFYALYLVLGLVGNGTAQLAYSRTLLTWFVRRRGLALALVLTGSGTGSILLPLVAQHVMAAYGWRSAYLALGALALLGFPLTAALMRSRAQSPGAPAEASAGTGMGALRSRAFWLIALPVLLSAFSINALIAHLAAVLTGRGVSPASAALALSVLGISGIVGRLVTGHLLDRLHAPFVSLGVLLLAGCGVAMLAFASTTSAGLCGAFLLGFGAGSEADVVPYLLAAYFGRRRFATLYGLSWTAYAIGGALGPVAMGHAFDRAGTYLSGSMLLFALPCVVAALLQLALPGYRGSLQSSAQMAALEPVLDQPL